ncbi:MAG: polyphosphate glucokinase [Mycobacterium sp.]|nr:polyphosphate glucokinase [Mycobacterium sp.]
MTESTNTGFGVDVGGSGIKGGIVDLDTGALVGERFKLATPQPATPAAVATTVAAVVREFGWTGKLGVTYPGVVTNGIVRTAANVDKDWIGTNAAEVISAELGGQEVTVLNDADAAGLAEEHYGAGKDNTGLIVLLTFGTGIGSAVIHNGVLLPNTEFGHLEVGGKEAEHRAASSVKERKEWNYQRWTEEVTKVLVVVENAIWRRALITTTTTRAQSQICRSARCTPTLSLQWSMAAAYRDSGGYPSRDQTPIFETADDFR